MWKIAKVVEVHPQFAPIAAELRLLDSAWTPPCTNRIVTGFARIMFPSLTVRFNGKPQTNGNVARRRGEVFIEYRDGVYLPSITFHVENNNTIGLVLHKFGHVCCGGNRPGQNSSPSPAEIAGYKFLRDCGHNQATVEDGAEIAAWCCALVLAAIVGPYSSAVLKEILVCAPEPESFGLRELIESAAERPELFDHPHLLLSVVGVGGQTDFLKLSEQDRFAILDEAVCLLLDELW